MPQQTIDRPAAAYGIEWKNFGSVEQGWLTKLTLAKARRNFYEQLWREWNYAYQMILLEYATQRKFNPSIAPEYQVRSMFPDQRLSDYRLPIEFAVITRQVADEWANLPITHWVSMSADESVRAGKGMIFQHTYDYFYDINDGDLETFKTLLGKAIYGTAMEYVFQEFMQYPDYEPSGVDKEGTVKFKKITRTINRPRFKNLDIRRVWFDANATDVDECEYGFIGWNYGQDTFDKVFANPLLYNQELVKQSKAMNVSDVYVSVGESRGGNIGQVVQVIRCFDLVKNEICHLANGRCIDLEHPKPIPVPSLNGKPRLPLAVFYDSPVDKEIYGVGKCFMLKPFRELKNKLRNMFFDVSKKIAFSTLVIDPDSDFDEDSYEFGQPFIRANPDEVKPLPVQANLQPAIELDKQTDQDIIWATGINFLDTAGANASESATKTAIRKESQVKLVELGLKVNTAGGFKRRALFLKQLIRLHYASGTEKDPNTGTTIPLSIKTKGVRMVRGQGKKGSYDISLESTPHDIGQFQLQSTDLSDDFDLTLEGGNISMTKELMKARQLEAVGFILKLPPDPQKALPFDVDAIAAWALEWGELPKNIGRGQPNSLQGKTPDQVIQGMQLAQTPPNMQQFLQNKGQAPSPPPNAGSQPSQPQPAAPAPAGR
jgi:hypothetical protein